MTRRRPRVVLVHYTAPSILGGVEQVMGAHAAALHDAGADVTIVAGRGRPPKGVRLIRIPEVDSRNESVLRDFRSLAQGERTKAHDALVERLVRKLRPIIAKADRVVVHNVMTMHKDLALTEALVRLARERPGVVIAWTHDLAWSDPQYASERHPGDPWGLIARAHPGVRYVAVSDERADQLAALAGLKREAVAVVPNGVDIAAALGMSSAGARMAERLDLYRADPLLVLPARLTRRKRIEAAMAATAALRGRGRAAMLVVTGPPGPHNAANALYLSELTRLAEGIEGETIHLGTGCTKSVGDIVAAAQRVCGREARVVLCPERTRPRHSEVMVLQSDPSRANDLLGWKAMVALEEGLRRTARWLRAHIDRFPVDYAV